MTDTMVAVAEPFDFATSFRLIPDVSEEMTNPTVQVEWCLKPELIRYMAERTDLHWALIIVAQRRADVDLTWHTLNFYPQLESRLIVEGTRRISDGRSFFTFRGAGEYDLVGYLVAGDPKGNFWPLVRSYGQMERRSYKIPFPLFANHYETQANRRREDAEKADDEKAPPELQLRKSLSAGNIGVQAASHVTVRVPDGIFAKPLPRWVDNWLGKWRLDEYKDQCQRRTALAIGFLVMTPLLLIAGFLWRLLLFVIGFAALICGRNGLEQWGAMFEKRVAPNPSAWPEDLPLYRRAGWSDLLRPIVVLFLAGVLYIAARHQQNALIFGAFAVALIITVAVILALVFAGYGVAMFFRHQRVTALATTPQVMERMERYAICGEERETNGPLSFTFVAGEFKRNVCRPT